MCTGLSLKGLNEDHLRHRASQLFLALQVCLAAWHVRVFSSDSQPPKIFNTQQLMHREGCVTTKGLVSVYSSSISQRVMVTLPSDVRKVRDIDQDAQVVYVCSFYHILIIACYEHHGFAYLLNLPSWS